MFSSLSFLSSIDAILLVSALSMDAFVASFAYGTSKIKIPFKSAIIINVVCKDGDNLWDIAKKYNTTEEEIAEVNEIKLDEPIKAGKCLILQKKVSNID